MPALVLVRPFTQQDINSVANVHVHAWQQAYSGIMDADFLAGLEVETSRRRWQESYEQHKNDPTRATLVAVTNDEIVGFLSYGPARDQGAYPPYEVYAINILQPYWGLGLGHTLFTSAAAQLRTLKASQTYLWVLSENARALRAYTRWGGRLTPAQTKNITLGGQVLEERKVTFSLSPRTDEF